MGRCWPPGRSRVTKSPRPNLVFPYEKREIFVFLSKWYQISSRVPLFLVQDKRALGFYCDQCLQRETLLGWFCVRSGCLWGWFFIVLNFWLTCLRSRFDIEFWCPSDDPQSWNVWLLSRWYLNLDTFVFARGWHRFWISQGSQNETEMRSIPSRKNSEGLR